MNSLRSRVVTVVLIMVLGLSPLFFGAVHAWTWVSASALIFFAFFLYPEAVLSVRSLTKPVRSGLAIVFLWVFLQFVFFSVNRYTTGWELYKWCSYLPLFFLCQFLTLKEIKLIFVFVAILTGIFCIYGLAEVLSRHEHVLWQEKEFYLGFVTGPYINRNHFAGFLEMSIGLQLGLWWASFSSKKGSRMLIYMGLLILSAITLIKTGSRTAIVSLTITSMAGLLFLKGVSVRRKVLFIAGFFFMLALAVFMGIETLLQRFTETDAHWVTWEGRFTAWFDALKMIMHYPVQGIGLGNFEWVFPQYQSASLFLGWAHAHNDYLELSGELGLPVAVVLAATFILWTRSISERMKKSSPGLPAYLVWGAFIGILSLMLHAFTDFNWSIPANSLYFVFLMGAVHRLSELADQGEGAES